jgi:hypothetical protein
LIAAARGLNSTAAVSSLALPLESSQVITTLRYRGALCIDA